MSCPHCVFGLWLLSRNCPARDLGWMAHPQAMFSEMPFCFYIKNHLETVYPTMNFSVWGLFIPEVYMFSRGKESSFVMERW